MLSQHSRSSRRWCAFKATFATDDYRPIHAAGAALLVLSVACVGAARGWRAGVVGIPLALVVLFVLWG